MKVWLWFLTVALLSQARMLAAADSIPAPAKARPAFKISKSTTCFTEPLTADGYVDYVAAINGKFSAGVTPENNAAVLLWRAVGPERINEKYRDAYCKALGISPLPVKGEYFVELSDYLRERAEDKDGYDEEKVLALRIQATSRPWSAKEHPQLVSWLEANRAPLALIVEASRRTKRFDPLAGEPGEMLFAALLPGLSHYRDVVVCLSIRAMRELGEGKIDAAWDDFMACHRLARLVGKGPFLVDVLLAYRIQKIAARLLPSILSHPSLTKERLARYEREYGALPPLGTFGEQLDHSERAAVLDVACQIQQKGLAMLPFFKAVMHDEDEPEPSVELLVLNQIGKRVDWNRVLRRINRLFDQYAAIDRAEFGAERDAAIGQLEARLAASAEYANKSSLWLAVLLNSPEGLARWVGDSIISISQIPADSTFQHPVEAAMIRELDLLAFRLAKYRLDHGLHPQSLSDLVPAYVPAVPRDLFSRQEVRYVRDAGGCASYSVGCNQQDDGGKEPLDDPEGDDLVMRLSVPKQGK